MTDLNRKPLEQPHRVFVTGTDTEVGKTFFSSALIHAWQADAGSVVALKPIAAGCEWQQSDDFGQYKNEDALALQAAQNNDLSYQTINPVALIKPVAPHIAAQLEGRSLSVSSLRKACPLERYSQDLLLLEGAGGWLVPLNDKETYADYVCAEKMDVILVVGLKLGCINHALLTQAAIKSSGLRLVGWVANHVDALMQNQNENLKTLTQSLDCPLIAEIPYIQGQDALAQASKCVKIPRLKQSLKETKQGR